MRDAPDLSQLASKRWSEAEEPPYICQGVFLHLIAETISLAKLLGQVLSSALYASFRRPWIREPSGSP
jgi:hypothetical protein